MDGDRLLRAMGSPPMRIRLRAPGGQYTVELAPSATVGQLKAAVFDKTGVAPEAQELMTGFPVRVPH